MNKLLQGIRDTVRVSLGHPVHIERFLATTPTFKPAAPAAASNIALSSVPQWHKLGQRWTNGSLAGTGRTKLRGWHQEGSAYRSFNGSCPSLSNLVKRVVVDKWICDLQDLHGFAASKSDLIKFASIDDMVETNSSEMIEDVSLAGLQKNLAHKDISVTGAHPGSDWLQVHQWDGRMFVLNDGGSHHLAAAKYIAARINEPVALSAPLHYYAFDPDAVAALRAEFDVYIVNRHCEESNAFFKAAEDTGVTWLWHEMPEPYAAAKAVFFPRTDALSMRVSQAFQAAGFEEFGAHLAELASAEIPDVISKYLPSGELGSDDVDEEPVARYG